MLIVNLKKEWVMIVQEMSMDQKIVDGHGGGRNDGAVDREIASPPFFPAETPQVHAMHVLFQDSEVTMRDLDGCSVNPRSQVSLHVMTSSQWNLFAKHTCEDYCFDKWHRLY